MPDVDDVQDGKNYHVGVPCQANAFFLKGSNSLDWGMKNRLARIFNPATGKTVMLAVDHGYFQGPTTGLERIDISIVPLVPYADALMITRGALRTSIPAEMSKPVVLRSSGGQSILKSSPTSWWRWISKTPCGSTRRPWRCRSISAASTSISRSAIW